MSWCFISLLLLILQLGSCALADVPHISECRTCDDCIVDTKSQRSTRYELLPEPKDATFAKLGSERVQVPRECLWDPRSIRLGPQGASDPRSLPHCSRCRGCTATLVNISSTIKEVGSVKFRSGIGGTDNWLFYGTKPGSETRFVVKASCMPVSKVNSKPKHCNPRSVAVRLQLQVAQWRLARECGVSHLLQDMWVEHTVAVVPGVGLPLAWDMLWIEEAPGMSLHALQQSAQPALIHDLLGLQLNGSQLVAAAAWDLLVGQCDRHIENVFVDLQGNIALIDHDKALGVVPRCGANSMLLPGSGFHAVLRTSPNRLQRGRHDEAARQQGTCSPELDPRILMDYRCHVPGGQLGSAYPAALQRCMRRIRDAPLAELCAAYGLPGGLMALVLKTRAQDMLSRGFEWTLQHGEPRNSEKLTLAVQPPCCQLQQRFNAFYCGHCWQPLAGPNATYSHFG